MPPPKAPRRPGFFGMRPSPAEHADRLLTSPRSWANQSASVLGAVAQLGERVVRNDEVRGSIPLCSTRPSYK